MHEPLTCTDPAGAVVVHRSGAAQTADDWHTPALQTFPAPQSVLVDHEVQPLAATHCWVLDAFAGSQREVPAVQVLQFCVVVQVPLVQVNPGPHSAFVWHDEQTPALHNLPA